MLVTTLKTMNTDNILTFEELINKIDLIKSDDKLKDSCEFLLSSINDWPTMNLEEPKDLLNELKFEIQKPLTFDNLKAYLRGLKIEISGNAWKMESIVSLLELFDYERNNIIEKEITLDLIIERLTIQFRNLG